MPWVWLWVPSSAVQDEQSQEVRNQWWDETWGDWGPHGRDRDRRARTYEDERRAPSNDGGGGKGDEGGEMREGKGKNAKDGGKARKGHDDPAPDPDEKGFRVQT